MRSISTYLVFMGISLSAGCATADARSQNSAEYLEKQKIAEVNNDASFYGCPASPTINKYGAVVAAVTPNFTRLSPSVMSDFTNMLGNDLSRDNLNETLNQYVKNISFKTESVGFGSMWCWTGNHLQYAQIDELKDVNTTWVAILIHNSSNPVGARKCTFSKNPNTWTTEVCPPKGSVG